MFGPLPLLHRILLVLGALVVWIGIGAWSGYMARIPVSLVPGILLGAALGVVSAYVLLHGFHHRPPRSHERGRRRLR